MNIKKKENFDCPHCGQDLRLSPDAKDEIEAARIEGFRVGREEAIRECADLTKEPCPYYPRPCGECRHCHLTRAAIRILSLLPSDGEKGKQ